MQIQSFNQNWTVTFENKTFSNVDLPFDAMIHSRRGVGLDNASNTGYFGGGHYVYQKRFTPLPEFIGKTVLLHFECAYQNASVYVNGKQLYFHPYGYTPFSVDISEYVKKEEPIDIKIEIDNEGKNSRYYSGGGIFRDVSLLSGDPLLHIEENGIRFLTTADYRINYEILHIGGEISVECYQKDKLIAASFGEKGTISIPSPILWDEEHPYLYRLCVKLKENGRLIEEHQIPFGLRYIEAKENGLFINGKSVKLRGACIHHDNGLLGAISFEEIEYRKLKILKEAGFNAVRISHQPASASLLEAADKLGIYVLDELFDMFYLHKNKKDYATYFKKWHLQDCKAMVEHDFNHPSVIIYSLGNELSETAFKEGVRDLKELADFIKRIDTSRPITAGINFFLNYFASKGKGIYSEKNQGRIDESSSTKKIMNSKVGSAFINVIMNNLGAIKNIFSISKRADQATKEAFACLDIAGYNYGSARYLKDKKLYPGRLILGSESFPTELDKNWKMVQANPQLIGDFIWTGWDYLGEAGIGVLAYSYPKPSTEKDYPYLLAGSGVIDILGNPRPEVYWNKLIYGLASGPYIAVEPVNHSGEPISSSAWRNSNALHCYSFDGNQKKKTTATVYSDGFAVELFLNKRSLGKKRIHHFKVTYHFPYENGSLLAKSYDKKGNLLGEDRLNTASGNRRIEFKKEDFGSYSFYDVSLLDKDNNLFCNDDVTLKIEVENGKLLAFGSANPTELEPYETSISKTYQGKALAIIKKTNHLPLQIHIQEVKQ